MSYPTTKTSLDKAVEAENLRNNVQLDTAYRRMLLLVKQENKRGEVPDSFRENFLMSSEELLDIMHVRLSMATLYRKYRGIYLHALGDALSLIADETTREGARQAIIDKLIEVGTVDKAARKNKKE